ncbi:MAG: ABC transporter permease [Elusimicrobiota bacterium]
MIQVSDLHKSYQMGKYRVNALRGVSLEIQRGEFIAIMGASGSGKSTLMHILGCLDKPDSGQYLFNGVEVNNMNDDRLAYLRNKYIGFIFQNFSLLSRTTALSNVELPMIYGNVSGRKAIAQNALDAVGLTGRINHKPNELSGGQQQRVAIARALANNPQILFADEPTGNLDTQSGKEIMEIIRQLNEKGITTVLVTHDPKISEYAKRIITINDGIIVNDEKKKDYLSTLTVNQNIANTPNGNNDSLFNMFEMFDSIKMSVNGLLANKLRSILAMLGVIIGVSAVIAMVSIGQGAKKDITKRIENMGSNLLTIMSARSNAPGSHAASAIGSSAGLKLEDVAYVKNTVKTVNKIAPTCNGNAQAIFGNKNTNTRICGTYPEYLDIRNFKIKAGKCFTEKEVKSRLKVAVLGNSVIEELFDENTDPIGKTIKINNLRFKIIGTLQEKGSGGPMGDEDDQIIIPLTTAQKRLFGKESLSDINIQVINKDSMDQANQEITAVLRKRHKLRDNDEDDFRIRSQAEILEMVSSTSKTFSLLLGGIASVSLLVGGIGIMNIMLVSVTERTREIGVRKAVGAKYRDILSQFLVEAVVICVIGGLIGVFLGIIVSLGIGALGKWPTSVSAVSIIISFCFAFIIGVIFGLYPAMNAAKLNPIDALRYE